MNHTTHAASEGSEPRRPIRTDFTARTLRHAVTAKRRAQSKQQIKAFFKEPFSMKSLKFLRTAPGFAVAAAVLATTTVSAYTISNWFGGEVAVKQNANVLSVDLSECKGALPPGIEHNTNRSDVKFKIVGDPHISAEQLQKQLLVDCEYKAVIDFYRAQPKNQAYEFHTATVKAVSVDRGVTLNYAWGGTTHEKTIALAQNAPVYNQGQPVSASELTAGDFIVFAVNPTAPVEGTNPLAGIEEVQSVFKTQYDTSLAPSASKNAFYEDNNILPL